MNATAPRPVLTAFEWVPEFARGLVRDLRVRWALEEIGRPYDTELLNARAPRPDEYLARQPFDQVPAFENAGLKIWETGAILLYLGELDERLLPGAGQDRWTAISWLFSALNSVEPVIQRIVHYDIFHKDKPWAPDAREACLGLCQQKLKRVNDALEHKDWLAGRFSIADIAMVTVLNNLRHTDLVADYPSLAAYKRRGEDRPAYKRALDAQFADFVDEPAVQQA
jgi:glutathione S-transferase